jgi:uncharacterized protein YhbP (UPF0306 family)
MEGFKMESSNLTSFYILKISFDTIYLVKDHLIYWLVALNTLQRCLNAFYISNTSFTALMRFCEQKTLHDIVIYKITKGKKG